MPRAAKKTTKTASKTASKKNKHEAIREEVADAMKAQEPTERESRIVALWTAWENAKAYLTKAKSETRTALVATRTALKDTMERTIAVGDDAAAKAKCFAAEVAWADNEEAKAQEKEATSIAKKAVKGAFERLNEAMSVTNQMGLDFQASTDAEDDESDADDDDDFQFDRDDPVDL